MSNAALDEIARQQQAARERWEAEQRRLSRKVRLQGAAMAATGLLLNLVNVVMIVGADRYFVLTLMLGPTMLFLGLWLAAAGRPVDARTAAPAKWGSAGIVAAIALGVLTSIVGFIVLSA